MKGMVIIMKINRSTVKLFLLLSLFWYLFTLDITIGNIIIGLIVSTTITIISIRTFSEDKAHMIELPNFFTMVKYFCRLIYEIYLSSFINMVRIIKKDQNLVIVKVELEVNSPLPITIIANSITLTPGTMTIDQNENVLTVMAIKDDGIHGEGIRKDIKEKFEKHFIRKG